MTKLDVGLITPLPASDSGSTVAWGSKRINPRPQSCLCLTWSGYPLNNDDDEKAYIHLFFTSQSNCFIVFSMLFSGSGNIILTLCLHQITINCLSKQHCKTIFWKIANSHRRTSRKKLGGTIKFCPNF